MAYDVEELRSGIVDLFDEGAERSAYVIDYAERVAFSWDSRYRAEPPITRADVARMRPPTLPAYVPPPPRPPRVKRVPPPRILKTIDARGRPICAACRARAFPHLCPG